jgi:hypothetical protein
VKRQIVTEAPRRINISTLVSKLRRIRTELGLMMQQVDDALARIDEEAKA